MTFVEPIALRFDLQQSQSNGRMLLALGW